MPDLAPQGQTSAPHSLQLAIRVNAPEGQASRPLPPLARKEIRFKVNVQSLSKLQRTNFKLNVIIITITIIIGVIIEPMLVQLAIKCRLVPLLCRRCRRSSVVSRCGARALSLPQRCRGGPRQLWKHNGKTNPGEKKGAGWEGRRKRRSHEH